MTIGFVAKLNFYDGSNNNISQETPFFQNLRPGNTSSAVVNVNNITCPEIAKIAYRGHSLCSANGELKLSACPFDITLPKNLGVIDINN